MEDTTNYAAYLGLDVGKNSPPRPRTNHQQDEGLYKALPQDEATLIDVFNELQRHSNMLPIVDQPNTIGACPSLWQGHPTARPPTCPAWQRVRPLTCTPVGPRLTRRTRSSSPIRPAPRRTPLCSSIATTRSFQLSRCCPDWTITPPRTSARKFNRLRNILAQICPSLERVFAGEPLKRTTWVHLLIHYGPTKPKKYG